MEPGRGFIFRWRGPEPVLRPPENRRYVNCNSASNVLNDDRKIVIDFREEPAYMNDSDPFDA